MNGRVACVYPEENPWGACYQWQVFETIWRLYQAGECGPMDGGVLTQRVAQEIDGIDTDAMRTRCRELEAEGAITRLNSVNPDTWGPTSSWAPTALLDDGGNHGAATRLSEGGTNVA